MESKILDLVKKVKELAERGIGGEKEAAILKLNKLIEKYNLTAEDLEDEHREEYKFFYKSADEKLLMIQTLMNVIGNFSYKESKTCNHLFFNLTVSEKIEFEYKFSVYKKLYRDELRVFFKAFIMKNKIYSKDSVGKSWDDLTPEQKQEHLRAEEMSSAIKKAEVFKQLK